MCLVIMLIVLEIVIYLFDKVDAAYSRRTKKNVKFGDFPQDNRGS